jgi:hypothetical protein
MSNSHSKVLFSVLMKLRGDGKVTSAELTELTSKDEDVGKLTDLLTDLGFVKKSGDKLVATYFVHMKPDIECVQRICEYVIGDGESGDFRRLMEYVKLGDIGVVDENAAEKKKDEVDPAVLKRYVKDYIEVAPGDDDVGGGV